MEGAWLPTLRRIDFGESDGVLLIILIKHRQRITIGDSDDACAKRHRSFWRRPRADQFAGRLRRGDDLVARCQRQSRRRDRQHHQPVSLHQCVCRDVH